MLYFARSFGTLDEKGCSLESDDSGCLRISGRLRSRLFHGSTRLSAQEAPPAETPFTLPTDNTSQPGQRDHFSRRADFPIFPTRETFSSAMQMIVLLTVLSLAPAILLMMTSFTRIIIVMSLLRQGLGTQQLPPNPAIIRLSMFAAFLVMGPTWDEGEQERGVSSRT